MKRRMAWTTMLAMLAAASQAGAEEARPNEPVATGRSEAAFAKVSEALKVGPADGYVKLGLLLQGWYAANMFKKDDWTNTFRLRRAEISVKGQVLQKPKEGGLGLGFGTMLDPARALEASKTKVKTVDPTDPTRTVDTTVNQFPGAATILQDFWISVQTDFADLSLGQFKIPVSWEGFNASAELLFAERALASRTFGDRRDLGLKIDKKLGPVYYFVGLFNGAGQNALDGDRNKDLAIRVQVTPLESLGVPGLMVGGALYMTLRTAQARPNARDRFEADLRFDCRPVLLQAEYIRARDYDKAGNRTTSQGFYAAVAGNLVPAVQLAARIGGLDQDVSGNAAGKTWIWETGGGVHLFLFDHSPYAANLKLDYNWLRPKTVSADNRREHQVVLAAQVRW